MLPRQTRFTREGYYFLIVLAFVLVRGLMKEINLMLALAGMMIGVFYFNWLGARLLLRRVKARRLLPASIEAGQATPIEIEVTSPHRASALVCEDAFHLRSSRAAEDAGRGVVVFPQVVSKRPQTAEYEVRFGRRGVYEFQPLMLISRYPFRLLSHSRRFKATRETLTVLPRLGRLTARWSRFRRGLEAGDRRSPRQQGISEGDFYGLRDWRHGDNRRWIHWRTSARRGALMVRQFEEPRSDDLIVLVDLWRPQSPSQFDEENVELAVSLAATIVAEACRQGSCQLTIGVTGERPFHLGGVASRPLGHDIAERLAVSEAAVDDDWSAWTAAIDSGPSLGRVVVVSTRARSGAEAAALQTAVSLKGARSAPPAPLRIDVSQPDLAEYFQVL